MRYFLTKNPKNSDENKMQGARFELANALSDRISETTDLLRSQKAP